MKNIVLLKGIIVLIGMIIFILGTSYLVFVKLNTSRKYKASKLITLIIFLCLSTTSCYVLFGFPFCLFEKYYFLEDKAIELLKEVEITLKNDFIILDHDIDKFISYERSFDLKISEKDVKKLLINRDVDNQNRVMVKDGVIENSANTKRTRVFVNGSENTLTYLYESD